MKTARAIKLAGSPSALAKLLGITPSAISQWGDEIPPLRQYELRDLRPEWFQLRVSVPASCSARKSAKGA
ncbi:hypothetical protein GCM10028796_17410 [Ramlibacter monticola]|uniref:Helix-turn-helix domain-containing protein n=1 Tax=Ramlibacter monticola TaxID=1926872 RepID=A0A936YXR1_9BURK|nr:helix-turn-helix domain-containing protein [Ramlibacter monticola]